MGLPFSLIFSIFLIVVFIVAAFIAVNYFLGLGRTSEVGLFYRDLQTAVDEAWSGQSSEFNFEVKLPSGIKQICFANLSEKITGSQTDYQQIKNYDVYDANVFLLPPENAERMEYKLIQHINVSRITEQQNPYCVSTDKDLKIKKDFYDKLVAIS